MFKKVLRIFTFGILGMTLHSFGTVAQEQGEEVLLPLPKPINITQDSIVSDFAQENKSQIPQTGINNKALLQEVGINQTLKVPENKANQSKVVKKDDSQSNLSFNFLYYIFYKFKPSDVLEKK
ncbi:MAG: hypothetical protein ACI9Z3_000047 [Roseivirga sp.]|jgi:hypothetical protein